ncbi:MAG: hypothetical protein JWP09_401 [Candidatus Taylorbacteria bacterium]|nr:hypothetical protein [Candidatus Taylorbacteria bacterium]
MLTSSTKHITKNLMKDKIIGFLKWTEKYTKTDMVYFVRSNLWINIGRASSVLNGLILSIVYANILTKEDYGLYTFALAFIGFFSMAQTTALGSGISKSISRGNDGVIYEGLKTIYPWSLLGGLSLGIVSIYYILHNNIDLGICFLVAAITLPISIRNSVAKSYFNAKGDFAFMSRFNLMRTPFITIALIITAITSRSAIIVVITSIITNLILGSFLYHKMKKNIAQIGANEKEPFAKKYAFHSGILSMFGYLSEQIDDLLLWKFVGAAPVAIYTYAIAPVRELKNLIENQSTIAIPKFAQKDFSEVKSHVFFRVRQMYFVAVPIIILYILSAPLIFKYLFPLYTDAVGLSQIASLTLLSSPRKLLTAAITAHQKIKETYIVTVFPTMTRIILAIALVPMYGIEGAVIALLASECIDFITLGILIRNSK